MQSSSTRNRLLVDARTAAQMLSVSQRTLYSLTTPRGEIPVIKLAGRSLRYAVDDLRAFVDSRREGGVIREPEMETE